MANHTQEEREFNINFDRRLNRLEGIVTGQAATLEHMNRTLTDIADRVHRPRQTNWGWIIAGATLMLMLAGGYTTVITDPLDHRLGVNEQVDANQNHILAERGERLGSALAQLEDLHRWQEEREDLDERVAHAEGVVGQLDERLDRLERDHDHRKDQ